MKLATIILASLIVSLASFSGSLLLIWKKLQSKWLSSYFVSFAAGVMLAAAFIDILPEALESANADFRHLLIAAMLGIVLFFFLERFVLWFHHHDDEHGTKPSVWLILFGDGIHNLIDGVAIAATFIANPQLGLVTTLAIAAHEIPQEIADFSVLVHGGLSKTRALFYNFISALASIFGAVLSYFFFAKIENFIPYILAFTGGMFIYIACSDLIPDLHREFKREKRWILSIPFIFGVALLWFLVQKLEG